MYTLTRSGLCRRSMAGSDYMVVLITAGSVEEARLIADGLLEQRKAACVNIVPGVSSLFWWQRKLEQESESLLIVKTEKSCLSELINLVRRLHSYEVPEVIALPVVGGNPDYLEWLEGELR